MNEKEKFLEELEKRIYQEEGEGFYATLEEELRKLNFEDKTELLASMLCQEWYLVTHFDHIKKTLEAFSRSL